MSSKVKDFDLVLDDKDENMLKEWKKAPLEVFVSTRILQVADIDDGKGTFNVQFLLMMLWRDLSLDTKILAKGAGHVLTEDEMDTFYRKPVIDFPNMTSQEDVIETEVRPKLIPLSFARVEFKHGPPIKDGDLGILSVRKVAGTFLEQFELKSFPVDMQKLHIIARPTEDTRAIMLRQFPSPFSKEVKPDTKLPPLRNHISPFARNVEPGWEFHYLTTFETLDTKSMSRAYSTVEFNLILVRRPQYYINQYYFCVLASQFFALMLFGTPPTVTDRFENLIGLLLTIIALSFSMSENVPKVPYHTLLDKFMNHSVYVLIVMGLETFLLTISMESEWITDSDAEKIDLTCGILLCVFWVVMILGHHVYIARRTMYVNNSYSRFCDTMWLLNGCKDSFDMFDEADQKGTQRRKSKVISNIVDWIMKSNEQIQKDSTLRKNMARFRSTLRSPDPSKAEIPILKNDSDMECLTRVKNACVYFSGTSVKSPKLASTDKFIDRKLSRPGYFARRNDILNQDYWLGNFLKSFFCPCSGVGKSKASEDFGDFDMLEEEYS